MNNVIPFYDVFSSNDFKKNLDHKIIDSIFKERINTSGMLKKEMYDLKIINELPIGDFYNYIKMISRINWLFITEDGSSYGVYTHPDGWECFVVHDTENYVGVCGYTKTDWLHFEFSYLKKARYRQDSYRSYLFMVKWLEAKYGKETVHDRDFDIEEFFQVY